MNNPKLIKWIGAFIPLGGALLLILALGLVAARSAARAIEAACWDEADWETMAPLPAGRVFNAVVADGGYVYVFGGASDASGDVEENTTYRYDTAANHWDTMAAMPASLSHIDAALINGKVYIPGDAATANTYVYDIAGDSWMTITANGGYSERIGYQTAVITSNLYVLGGLVSLTATNQVWVLDTTSGNWLAGTPMQRSRTDFSAAAIGGVIYTAGGVYYPNFIPDMTAEKFEGGAWSYIAGVPDGGGAYTRWSYNADASTGFGLWLAGGRRDANWEVLNHTGFYDVATNSWVTSDSCGALLNQPRVYMEGDVAGNGYFYVVGGRNAAADTLYANNERLRIDQTYTWNNGAGDGDWSNPLNWQPQSVPALAAESVFIPGGLGRYPSVPADVTFRNLTITAGGEITIPNGVVMSITGQVQNSGRLYLARLVDGSGLVSYTIPGTSSTAYYGLSISPTLGSMGVVTATICGSQTCNPGVIIDTVKRCYDIEAAGQALVRFYYLESELNAAGGNQAATLKVHHWNAGSHQWETLDSVTGGASPNWWVEAQVNDFSPLALKSDSAPSALRLNALRATPVGRAAGLLAVILVLGGLGACLALGALCRWGNS